MDGCIYRTKDGECDLYAEGGKYKAWCDMENCDGRKVSNADRIRSMTDEELANCITDDLCDRVCHSPLSCDGNCEIQVLAWLKQETTDE